MIRHKHVVDSLYRRFCRIGRSVCVACRDGITENREQWLELRCARRCIQVAEEHGRRSCRPDYSDHLRDLRSTNRWISPVIEMGIESTQLISADTYDCYKKTRRG